jgi:putative transcriptional regulator
MQGWTQKRIEAAAKSDPDNQPLSPADFARMKRTPQVKIIRRALGLSQEEFSARYQIPIGTLRDWEQGRAVPDQAARAYLKVIARAPEATRKALDISHHDFAGFSEPSDESRRYTAWKRKRARRKS